MLAYKELQDILDTTVEWEKKMLDLYEVAEIAIKQEAAKDAIKFLKSNHSSHMEILKNIDVKDYGPNEYVKFTKDYHEEDIVPQREIHRDSTADELCEYMLEYENKMRDFYQLIRDHLTTEQQRELFDSLVTFKENQIENILNCKNKHI